MLEMRQNQNEEIEQILFENTALTADTGEETAEQTAADSATESNAADSMTLQVAEKETALQAIRKSIEEAGGYEGSSADDVIQAVIPAANYADLLEQVGKLGEIPALFQAAAAGAWDTISISLTEKIKRDTVDFYEKSRVLFLLKFSWGQRILICFAKNSLTNL